MAAEGVAERVQEPEILMSNLSVNHKANLKSLAQSESQSLASEAIVNLKEVISSTSWLESHPVTPVRIDSLVIEGSPRLGGEEEEHIRLLAEAPGPLPAITVHGPTMRVIDGAHRVRANVLKGEELIQARLLHCDEGAAFVLAVKANITHGLPLSKADRTAAAGRIITYQPYWSNRAVARAAGLSDKTVAKIRSRSGLASAQPAARLGRDGRLRPLDTAVRRQQAAELLNENPDAGLRELAGATGLSVATVRDVRQRIVRGEDPVPVKYQEATCSRPVTSDRARAANRSRHREVPSDPHALLEKLRRDPSLRLSETGRNALRWLHSHIVDTNEAGSVSRDLPHHCAPIVAAMARSCAVTWTSLAEQMEGRVP